MCQDKKNVINTEDASGLIGGSALKVAIYYVGDAKCRAHLEANDQTDEQIEKVIQANNDPNYMAAGKNTHRLDGNNAALINAEYKGNKENPLFGGEMFLKTNDIARTLANVEDNCRRVLLSVDAEEILKIDSDNLAADSDATENWPQRFASDFGDFGGTITCGHAQSTSLCSFANINGGKRYFAYLYPKLGENSIAAKVTYKQQHNKQQTATITVESIARNELQLPTTKLSDIMVNADCGANNSCLFIGSTEYTYKLECRVQGANCGNVFTYKVEQLACGIDVNSCEKIASPTVGKLCTGEATVAQLSEDETHLTCELTWINPDTEKKHNLLHQPLRIDAAHLAGKLCVVTTTQSNAANRANALYIKEDECERNGEKLQNYRLELSFRPR